MSERARRAAESILENERLTAGLDDPVAQALLHWGVDAAEHVAASISGLDDPQAEEALASRLQAVRRTMRRVRSWIVHRADLDAAAGEELLAEVLQQAALIYDGWTPPGPQARCAFLSRWRQYVHDPLQLIARLRSLVEGERGEGASTIDRGEDCG